jgi:hypothetical protein
MRVHWLLLAAAATATGGADTAAAQGESAPVAPSAPLAVATSRQGLAGVHRLELAEGLTPRSINVSLASEFFDARSFLARGDHHQRWAGQLTLAAAVLPGLDVALGGSLVSNSNRPALREAAHSTGDPSLTVKYSHSLWRELRLGAVAQLTLPTSLAGGGLAPGAFTGVGQLVASYQGSRGSVAANAGYRLDRTSRLLTGALPADSASAYRFSTGGDRQNSFVMGLGGQAHVSWPELLALQPFLELCGQLAPGVPARDSPWRATAGAKLLPYAWPVELSLGADVRLAGAPTAKGSFAGLPPWQALATLTFHAAAPGAPRETPPPPLPPPPVIPRAAGEPAPCTETHPCLPGQTCIEGACILVREVEKEVVREVTREAPSFVIAGTVTDAASNRPIKSATVRLSAYDGTQLTTDANGAFKTWPIAVDEGILQLTIAAPGYKDGQQTLAKGPPGVTKELVVALSAIARDVPGMLQGSLQDARTGKPLAGVVLFPAGGRRLRVGKEGDFEAKVKPGRYNVIVSSPHHVTQKKVVQVSPGEIVILNIDMAASRR